MRVSAGQCCSGNALKHSYDVDIEMGEVKYYRCGPKFADICYISKTNVSFFWLFHYLLKLMYPFSHHVNTS